MLKYQQEWAALTFEQQKVKYHQKCKQEYVDSHQKKVRNKQRGIHEGIYDEFYRDIHLYVIRHDIPC